MTKLDIFTSYLQAGLRLIPIPSNRKGPVHHDWDLLGAGYSTEEHLKELAPANWGAGLHHMDSQTCALDIDNMEQSRLFLAERGVDLDQLLAENVQIVSGVEGHGKILFRMPPWQPWLPSKQLWYTDSETNKKKAFIDFRSANVDGNKTRQDVLPPSIHPGTGQPYQWFNGTWEDLQPIPQEILTIWLDLLAEQTRKAEAAKQYARSINTDEETIWSALCTIDPDCSRDDWYRCGMALQLALGEAGKHLWHVWSSKGEKYQGEREIDTVWASFREDKLTQATLGTLFYYAMETGWRFPVRFNVSASPVAAQVAAPEPDGSMAPEDPQAEAKQLIADVRAEFDKMKPVSRDDSDQVQQVHILLWEVLKVDNPALTDPVLEEIRRELDWTKPQLRNHIAYVRRSGFEVLGAGRANQLVLPEMNDAGGAKDHSNNLRALCEHRRIMIRHNLMNHDIEVFDPAKPNWLEDEKGNLQRSYLRDLMVQHNIPYNRSDEHILSLASENAYHPMAELIDRVRWDGRDWFTLIADTVISDDRYKWHMTLRRWALSAMACALGVTGNRPPRGVITLQSEQNMGKTSWFRYLTPDGMFGEGHHLDPANKDSLKLSVSKWIVELGELDATFSKADIARLKAHISSPQDEVRLPYARTESRWARRTVYAGTVNKPEFLHDRTGNSRFWVSRVTHIDLDAMESIRAQGGILQFWAHVRAMLAQGERWWLSQQEMAYVNRDNERFLEMDPYEDLLKTYFGFEPEFEQAAQNINTLDCHPINPMTMTQIAAMVGVDLGRGNTRSSAKFRDALCRLTGQDGRVRSRHRTWDAVTATRSREAQSNRFYWMPYIRPSGGAVARVVTPNFGVVSPAARNR